MSSSQTLQNMSKTYFWDDIWNGNVQNMCVLRDYFTAFKSRYVLILISVLKASMI